MRPAERADVGIDAGLGPGVALGLVPGSGVGVTLPLLAGLGTRTKPSTTMTAMAAMTPPRRKRLFMSRSLHAGRQARR